MRHFKELPYRRLIPLGILSGVLGYALAKAGLGLAGFYVATVLMSPLVMRAIDIPGYLDSRRPRR